LTGESAVRGIAGLFGLGAKRSETAGDTVQSADDAAPICPTRALPKFLAALDSRDAPVLLDLGPVVGGNVTFLGERLGCKIFVEDLFTDLDRLTRQGGGSPFSVGAFLKSRLTQERGSVDGILCWDLFEYLDPESTMVLAGELTQRLRPGGALFALFRTEWRDGPGHTKFEIVDETRLRYRFCAGARGRLRVLPSREALQAFDGLVIDESFLLKIGIREMLFRKARGSVA
jgi:hypothetical protein